MHVCVCVCICIYIYMFLNTRSLFIRASCVVGVYLEVILWTSLPIMPGLYNKYTHTETWADPYTTHPPPPHGTPETSCQTQVGTKHRNCLFLKAVLWFHIIHLTKTSSTFSVTSEIPEQSKTGRNRWRPREWTQRHFSKLSIPDF